MKTITFAFAFIILTLNAFAKTTDGYYVTMQGDTIAGTIVLDGYDIYSTVKIEDDKGIWQMFMPNEIKSFGYKKGSKSYVFRSAHDDDGVYLFLKLEISGKNTDLYHCCGTGGFLQKKNVAFIILEKPDKSYLFLSSYLGKEFLKGRLTFFYRDNPEAKTFIKSLFIRSNDLLDEIKELIDFVNGS